MKSTDVLSPIALGKIIAANNSNDIPVNATGNEYASQEEGFPEITMLPETEGGEAPHGKDFNGLLKLVSSHLFNIQNGIAETFDATVASLIGGYPKGAMLWKTDENGAQLLQSTKDDNTDNFNTNPAVIGTSWIESFPTVEYVDNKDAALQAQITTNANNIALKANTSDAILRTGNQSMSGTKTVTGTLNVTGTATVPDKAAGDKTTAAANTKFVTNAIDTLNTNLSSSITTVNNNALHKTDAETKTDSLTLQKTTTQLFLKNPAIDITSTTTQGVCQIRMTDKNNINIAQFTGYQESSGENRAMIYVRNHANNAGSSLYIGYDKDDNFISHIPTPVASNSTSNTAIATVGWVNNPASSTNVLHRSGNEIISGCFKQIQNGSLRCKGTNISDTPPTESTWSNAAIFMYNNDDTLIGAFSCRAISNGQYITRLLSGNSKNNIALDIFSNLTDPGYAQYNKTPTIAATDNSTKIPTTAWVNTRITSRLTPNWSGAVVWSVGGITNVNEYTAPSDGLLLISSYANDVTYAVYVNNIWVSLLRGCSSSGAVSFQSFDTIVAKGDKVFISQRTDTPTVVVGHVLERGVFVPFTA